jgi:hypothetical protein
MVKYSMIIVIFILITILSCSKDYSPLSNNNILKNDAILRWTGEYAADGCGFFIIINNHEYKPENESIIDDSLKMNFDIDVIIEYKILRKKIESWCWDLPNVTLTDGINIVSIEKTK